MDTGKHNDESFELDSGSEAFALLADEFCSRELWAEAVRVCHQGLAFQPRHLRGHVLLGWALKELGEGEEAERVLREAAGEIQKNALLFSLLAEIAEKAGDAKRAELLLDICQNLRETALEEAAPSEVKTGADPTGESRGSATATLLTSLLKKFEAKPVERAPKQRIFSAEDRLTLTQILKSRKH
jgi:hypothetical protein